VSVERLLFLVQYQVNIHFLSVSLIQVFKSDIAASCMTNAMKLDGA